MSADFTWPALHPGWLARTSAATPAAYGLDIDVPAMDWNSCPGGPAAQSPGLEAGKDQECVDPEDKYRSDDDVLPPHRESPLVVDTTPVLPEVAVFMPAWMRSPLPTGIPRGCQWPLDDRAGIVLPDGAL